MSGLTEQERAELATAGTHFGAMVTIAGRIADEREARTREAIAVGIEASLECAETCSRGPCRRARKDAAIARTGGAA